MNELLEARKRINDKLIRTASAYDPKANYTEYEIGLIGGRHDGLREAQMIIDEMIDHIIEEMAQYNGET